VLTLFIILIVVTIGAALAIGIGGFGPRVIRRTTIVDRPPVDRPVRTRRVVEEETVDRTL
jgi:hypothetical protein